MVDDPNKPPWDDVEPPPTEEELAESERLRQALEEPRSAHPDAELARALRHAVDPRPLDELSHRRILDRFAPKRRRFEIGVVLAAAAAVLVAFVALQPRREVSTQTRREAPTAALIKPHTTQALFAEPFPREGETSKRVDAIALSRGRDLRNNRWAKWGVK
ncbi:MAG: hypothetical protein HYV09_17125 [Deltaproteobacteria bacterium]|nr:hypothetical protein [Deltaproteobacteria bacterium]